MRIIWKQKTLTNLEKDEWKQPDNVSRLVARTIELRKIPLDKFTTEDLRLMIGQQFSLDYLVPLAFETLSVDLFAEGDFFEGDLLKKVLSIRTEFWDNNKVYWLSLNDLIKNRRNEIVDKKFDLSNFDKCKHRQ
ncbi:MAG: hypothetical protein IPF54_05750 [Draconibacterium sp.]|nr:hypothetical protein [Draconibacterium sp.]